MCGEIEWRLAVRSATVSALGGKRTSTKIQLHSLAADYLLKRNRVSVAIP